MRILIITFNLVSFAFILAVDSYAQSVPNMVNYQGRLTDQSGAPLAAGTYTVQLRLWDSSTPAGANDLIWGQQQTVTVQTNGVFNVLLGSPGGTPITAPTPAVNDLTFAFSATNRYLGVTVAAENGVTVTGPTEILPRQQLLSVPYAIQAQQAQQAQVANSLITNLENALCPSGTIVAFGGNAVPNGWLMCNGSGVSRSAYANLFATIGSAWGNGDGSSTFNLPDLRGLFLRGVNSSRNDSFADPDDILLRTNIFVGGNIGNSVGSYQVDQFASHQHISPWGETPSQYSPPWGTYGSSLLGSGNSDYDNTWGLTSPTGGNETRPKNAYVNYIIKY